MAKIAGRVRRACGGGRRYQTGLGALGWLAALAIGSFALTCFFRVGPAYLDYWNTKQSLDVVMQDSKTASLSKFELQRAIGNQLDVSMIKTISAKDIRITEVRGGREVDASYEQRVPLIANIDVVVKFDKLKYLLPNQ